MEDLVKDVDSIGAARQDVRAAPAAAKQPEKKEEEVLANVIPGGDAVTVKRNYSREEVKNIRKRLWSIISKKLNRTQGLIVEAIHAYEEAKDCESKVLAREKQVRKIIRKVGLKSQAKVT